MLCVIVQILAIKYRYLVIVRYKGQSGASFSKNKKRNKKTKQKKTLSPLVTLSMGQTMITKVISEPNSISRCRIFFRNWPLVDALSFYSSVCREVWDRRGQKEGSS